MRSYKRVEMDGGSPKCSWDLAWERLAVVAQALRSRDGARSETTYSERNRQKEVILWAQDNVITTR